MRIFKSHPLLKLVNSYVIDSPQPSNISYLWNFGSLLAFCLVIQIVTGVTLAMHYNPSVLEAFNSVEHIMRDVNNGWLIRYLHSNTASAFFFIVYLHIGRGLYYGSYKAPRTLVWTIGTVIFILMMATAFLGYVLPYGQMSLWGATVITNLMSAIPWVGQDIVEFIWGGFSVNNATLNRFFALHFVLPFILAALALMHLIALHDSAGSGNPLGVSGNSDRLPFAPYFIFKDLITIFIFILALSIFVFFMPNVLGDSENYVMANPMQTPPAIVPEWYLLPFYAILRSIPNKLLGVIAMFSAILILLTMPFTDLSRSRGIQFRPLSKIAFFIFIGNFLILMQLGGKHVESPFIEFGQISTVLYFAHFLLIVPLVSLIENSLIELASRRENSSFATRSFAYTHIAKSGANTWFTFSLKSIYRVRHYNYLEWGLNSIPKPYAFVSLPLQCSPNNMVEWVVQATDKNFQSLFQKMIALNHDRQRVGAVSVPNMDGQLDDLWHSVKDMPKWPPVSNQNTNHTNVNMIFIIYYTGIDYSLASLLTWFRSLFRVFTNNFCRFASFHSAHTLLLIGAACVIYSCWRLGLDLTTVRCDAPRPWGVYFQDSATPQMEGLVELHDNILFYLVIILFGVGWILASIIKSYKSVESPISHKYLSHGTLIELIWTITPALILILIAFPSFKLLYLMDEVSDPAMAVLAEGHQWYWSYQYPDFLNSDDEFIEFDSYLVPESDLEDGALRMLEVDNRLIIPELTHVRFIVTGADVIHSFACPALGIKCDAYPGRLNQVSVMINREGTFYGQCSEICGILHSSMPIVIESVSIEKFVAWLLDQ